MRFLLDLFRANEGERVRRRVEVAIVLSLLLHGAVMWKLHLEPPELTPGDALTTERQPLSMRLVPAKPPVVEPPQASAREAPPKPEVRPRTVRPVAPRVPPPMAVPSPPVIAAPTPAPRIELPPPSPPVAAAPVPQPSTAGDLASYIAERRRARGESGEAPATVDSESARRDRAIASNLASLSTSTVGNVPQNGGGSFMIRRMDFDDAQFTFYGWNRDIERRMFQVIDVRRGSNPTINLAIVRRIIEIIRDHEPGDFRWASRRLARDLTLSARLADTGELETFMMQEFFSETGQPR